MKRDSNKKRCGNEVYYTKSEILLVKNMLRSKLHCQKGVGLILFSYEVGPEHVSSGTQVLEYLCREAHPVQGYLANKKQRPPRTLP
jgi:hypothetical protein